MHSFDVNEPAVRLNFQAFTSEVETSPLAVGPFVTHFPSWARITNADRHGPAIGTEHPFLNQLRVSMRTVYSLGRRGKAPRNNDVFVAFGFQSHFAHRVFLFDF